ncbi:MAG: hypothetical protein JOS17DRAFT_735713 [Linnemannia elongata]|nr:MAG: hypothetical protein JOS17DRAFT_735713 [Linnemannia elongata]
MKERNGWLHLAIFLLGSTTIHRVLPCFHVLSPIYPQEEVMSRWTHTNTRHTFLSVIEPMFSVECIFHKEAKLAAKRLRTSVP